MKLYGLITLLFFVQFSFAQGKAEQGNKSVHAFWFQVNDLVKTEIKLESNEVGNPKLYTSHLQTDVCSDGLCKPINITIEWNLLGHFHGYKTDQKHVLTKFDHVELTAEDHKKLHQILSDTASILRDYKVEDMIDTTSFVRSLKIDAVTGATSKTFDGVTVEGALYTVYTLWHFINGDVRKNILNHTRSLLSDSFVQYMLKSDDRDQISFILANITDLQRQAFLPEIIKLVSHPDDYIPHFALAQLTDKTLSNYSNQHLLLGYIPNVAPHLQNAILDRLKNVKLDNKGLASLINSMPGLKATQMNKAFTIIENNKTALNKKLLKEIENLPKK
ncbi:hypothetical protein [Pedobacter immunditicola]|uniref:hypothetical protein n=1 Tax=Pedobacter immunditicola TaxID=3133440 RepID=UPI0030A54FC7